ncbi:hypothetical protein SDC9_58129 [bioreactor metagenome]|uniref:Uncharacterized protein n=1 Tax=bioreactor metagenome TaxID=1076179 RepID=A0A644X7K1_9ZZZZ
MIQSDPQTGQDMRTGFRFSFVECGSSADNFFLVFQVVDQNLLESKHFRDAFYNRQHIEAERGLERRQFVQIVQNDAGADIFADIDDDTHAVAVGLIRQVGYAFDPFVAGQFSDPLDQFRLVDHIRQFGNDDAFFAVFQYFDFYTPTDNNRSFTCFIGFPDT